jgi:hypothetical protein
MMKCLGRKSALVANPPSSKKSGSLSIFAQALCRTSFDIEVRLARDSRGPRLPVNSDEKHALRTPCESLSRDLVRAVS